MTSLGHSTGLRGALACVAAGMLAGCALVTGMVGLGQERDVDDRACRSEQNESPLRGWGEISGEMNVQMLGGGRDRGYTRLVSPVAVAAEFTTVHIADGGQNSILRFDRSTQTVRGIIEGMFVDGSTRLFVDRANSLYVSDERRGEVTQYDLDGRPVRVFGQSGSLSRPVAVWVDDARGEILVGDAGSAAVVVFNTAGGVLASIRPSTDDGGTVESIADIWGGPDQLYILDPLQRRVHLLSRRGSYRYGFGEDHLTAPTRLAVDGYNRVYVADSSDSTIKVFRGGELVAVVGGRRGPDRVRLQSIGDMWAASDGFFYVADPMTTAVKVFKIEAPCER